MKHLLTVLFFIILFTFSACASAPESPPLEPIKFQLPNEPQDYSQLVEEIKKELGAPPQPKVIKQGGITYFGFTKEQMVKFRLFNEAFAQLEKIIESQHKQTEIYFMEIKTLKALAEAQNEQAKNYKELYDAIRNESKRKAMEALGYKILTFGSIIAIIALAF